MTTAKNIAQSTDASISAVVNDSIAQPPEHAETVVVNASIWLKCDECEKPFQPYRTKIDRYCSTKCKLAAWAESHVRVHKSDLARVIGKDWKAKIDAAKAKRKGLDGNKDGS